MEERRVVITGTGIVSPVGNDVAQFWSALQAGRCGITSCPELAEQGLPVHVAGVVRDFDPALYDLSVKETKRNDRFCLFAQAATSATNDDSRTPALEPPMPTARALA